MTDLQDEADPPIPTRVRRLSDETDSVDSRADYVLPLATISAVVAVLGLTCAPITTALAIAAARDTAAVAATTMPTTGPTPTLPPGGPGPVALILVGVFVLIALCGIVGGIYTILFRNWGRRLLIAYAAMVLVYLGGVILYRLSLGLGGLTSTAPTNSALVLSLVCSFGTFAAVAGLMVTVLRYFTRRDVARRFG